MPRRPTDESGRGRARRKVIVQPLIPFSIEGQSGSPLRMAIADVTASHSRAADRRPSVYSRLDQMMVS
jgi:hypothetical protein